MGTQWVGVERRDWLNEGIRKAVYSVAGVYNVEWHLILFPPPPGGEILNIIHACTYNGKHFESSLLKTKK